MMDLTNLNEQAKRITINEIKATSAIIRKQLNDIYSDVAVIQGRIEMIAEFQYKKFIDGETAKLLLRVEKKRKRQLYVDVAECKKKINDCKQMLREIRGGDNNCESVMQEIGIRLL